MSTKNNKLFKDAIADAKAIRETALINAKQTIEEVFAPKIQEMFDSKLSEMEDDDYTSENESSMDGIEEDFDLSSILAELEEEDAPLNEGEEDLDEAKEEGDDEKDSEPKEPKKDSKPKSEPKKDDKPKEPKAPKTDVASMSDEDDINIGDLSVEDFKSLISDVISQQLGDGGGVDVGLNSDDDLSANPGMDNSGLGDLGDDNSLDQEDSSVYGGENPDEKDEDLDLEELLNELDNMDSSDDEDSLDEVRAELNEAIKTIKIQSAYINETKIVNAKLRYLTSILNESNYNSNQKVKIVEAFDKAQTLKEAKLVYESLKTNVTVAKKQPIKESLYRSSASKPTGSSTRNNIIDIDNTMARMQKLANIK